MSAAEEGGVGCWGSAAEEGGARCRGSAAGEGGARCRGSAAEAGGAKYVEVATAFHNAFDCAAWLATGLSPQQVETVGRWVGGDGG